MASKKKLDNSNISKHLGQTSQYKSTYDPSLLVREPRQSNRTHLDIKDESLPFVGSDTWNAYEVSGLTDNGLPVAGIAKIVYSCNSTYIVESKSLKLYFNTFNMSKLGPDAKAVFKSIENHAVEDLTSLLGVDVHVRVFSNDCILVNEESATSEWGHCLLRYKNESYITLEEEYPVQHIKFSKYSETPDLLRVVDAEVAESYYHSSLLKSNCRVTSQPDWGDVYIYMKGSKTVDPLSLLEYIVSFRDECHFHEEICETIYKRIQDIVNPDELCVRCLYARRGGVDINPERASHTYLLHNSLGDASIPHVKTPKQ
jgi:7-cyano-7-deazaguanine reductase